MAGGAGSSNGTEGILTKIKAATIATGQVCQSMLLLAKSDALIEAAEGDQGWFLLCCAEKDFVPRNNGWPSMLQSQGTIG